MKYFLSNCKLIFFRYAFPARKFPKSFLLPFLSFFIISNIFSNALINPPGTENTITASKIFVDAKKNIYITGSFTGIVRFSKTLVLGSYGSDDIFIAKYNSDGECLWASNAGSDGFDEGKSIIADEAGYVYITGLFEGKALFGQMIVKGDKQNIFVAKYNPSGDPIWIKTGKGKEGSSGCDIKLDKFNNCYVAGCFYNTVSIANKTIIGFGGSDILLLKFSPKGELIWGKAVGGKQNDVVNTSCLQIVGDNLFIAGYFNDKITFGQFALTSNGGTDAVLAKFNTNGDAQWAQSIGGKGFDYATGISTDKEGSIYLAGNFDSTFTVAKNPIINSGESDVFIAKYHGGGKNQWTQSFGTGGIEKSTCCSTDGLGNLYIGGCFKSFFENQHSSASSLSFSSAETFGNDLFVVKYKGEQKEKWSLLAGGNGNDEVVDMCSDRDGNVYILGVYDGSIKIGSTGLSNNGGIELFIAKVNPTGSYSFIKNAVSPEPSFGDKNKYVNYYAKLMYGKEKSSLVNQVVNLKDSKGEVIQSTKTDSYGDFSFKGISTTDNVNIVLEKNDSLPTGESIFLANQNGEVTKELTKDKNNDFTFDILSSELMKLTMITEEDNTNKLKNFKSGKETEVTILENILYDPGEWNLLAENTLIINKLVNTMKANPNYAIEIYSFTDAVGDAKDNMVLSEKRAKAIVDLFIKKGIKADRIKGTGFGESKIINRCVDGVECSEKEHQVNRRTEFKFVKEKK